MCLVGSSVLCYKINSFHNQTFEGQDCLHRGLNATEINFFPCQSPLSLFPMTAERWNRGLILAPPPPLHNVQPPPLPRSIPQRFFHFIIEVKWIWQCEVNKDYPQSYLNMITLIHSRDQKEPAVSRTEFGEISCGGLEPHERQSLNDSTRLAWFASCILSANWYTHPKIEFGPQQFKSICKMRGPVLQNESLSSVFINELEMLEKFSHTFSKICIKKNCTNNQFVSCILSIEG